MTSKKSVPSAYPLQWPDGWPRRSNAKTTCPFRTTLSAALNNVRDELRRFGTDSGKPMTDVMISSNVSLGDQNPKDPGVAVYFTWEGLSTCIAVDLFDTVENNLQAIYHVLDAERKKLRYGGLNLVRAAFRGYAALPPPSRAPTHPWSQVLDISPDAPMEEVEAAYRRERSGSHPDKGGNAAHFDQVQRAWEQFKQERGIG